jgi:thiol-disulfide isomerase/thioredoxin
MPKFKDTRKAAQSPHFNGWTDDLEPRSPLAELFSKLVPVMTGMKKKGAFHFPPPPPHSELPSPAISIIIPLHKKQQEEEKQIGNKNYAINYTYDNKLLLILLLLIIINNNNNNKLGEFSLLSSSNNQISTQQQQQQQQLLSSSKLLGKGVNWERPELSDYGCSNRILTTIDTSVVAELITTIRYRFGADSLKPTPPLNIEDTSHFEKVIKNANDKLFIVMFFATWCSPCRTLLPVFRLMSMRTPTAIFLKVFLILLFLFIPFFSYFFYLYD